ncbi:unnamed protein product [Paramecium primaurelia]|uniref:Uncharacterized protein n=1 Tax=Paramecium primaurelia TaxID=5886 RepID=A0A8S1LJ78_PARPR|nr:unnamed protein product [Paramecium primaurelia]
MASEIYDQLVTVFTNTDNKIRNETEKQLVTSLIDNFQNFQQIAKVAMQQDKMQEQAASLLNSVILKMLTNSNQLSIHHANSILAVLMSQYTSLKCKQSLIKCMSLIVRKDKSVKTEIENKMKEFLRQDQQWQFQIGILFFKILLDSLELQTYSSIVQTGYEWISEFFNLTAYIITKLTEQPKELADDFITTIRLYTQVVSDLCEKVFDKNNSQKEQTQPIQNILFQLNSFSGVLIILLSYSPQIGKQIQNCSIINTGNDHFDNQLNEIKCQVFKIYFLTLQVLLNTRNKNEVKKGAFGPYLTTITQLLIYSLLAYTNTESIHQIYNKPYLPTMMTYIMKLLANLGTQTEQYQIFSDSKIALITDAIYPFLITSQKEYQQMKDQPEEFVNLALDSVDKQQSDVPKTAAASLLETLCDHIDGSTTFLANLAIIISQHSINMISNNPIQLKEQQVTFVQALQDKKLFKEYSPVDRIESSLVILTIMSYLIQKRLDIVLLMEQLLSDNLLFFQNVQDQIIKLRLSLFFGYYCDNLFKKDTQSQNMNAYLQIMISFVQPQEPVVLYQSIDALKDIFEDDDLKIKTKDLVVLLFPQLCNALQYSTYERHFETITNLLKRYPYQFLQNDNLLIGLIQVLTQRVIIEQQKINSGDQQRHIYLNRCWNVLRSLADQDEFSEVLGKLEQHLGQLYSMLANCDKIDFDEDLVLFISGCISKLSIVTELQMQILPYFQNIIKKQQGRLCNLFETLNQYMHFGRNYFINEAQQSIYFQLAFQNLQNEDNYGDIEQGEGALLIQLGIQELHDDLKINILSQILFQTITILQKPDINEHLRSRITGIILSSLYKIPEKTYEVLSEVFPAVYNRILDTQYSPGYDIKLFIITMSSLIMKQPNLLTSNLLTIMVNNLIAQEKYEKDQKFKQNDYMDDELDDEDDSDFNDEEEITQAQQQTEQFLSSIVKLDEYSLFKQTILCFKNLYPQIIDQLRNGLDQQIINKINEQLQFIRVETQDGEELRKFRQLKNCNRKKQFNN